MLLFLCEECFSGFRVLDESVFEIVDAPQTLTGAPCPICASKKTQGCFESTVDGNLLKKLKIRDLEPIEFMASIEGMGLPEEQQCDLDTLCTLLKGVTIHSVGGQTIPNTTRTVVDFLVLSTGHRIYFGAGPAGAVVYRIVKPGSYTSNVLKEGK